MVLPYINMNPPQVYTCSPSWTLLPPPSPYHPSGSSQCTSPKHPVSCIEPGLATRSIHDIMHVSMPFSQFIPPSSSPIESKRLFYTFFFLKVGMLHFHFYSVQEILFFFFLFFCHASCRILVPRPGNETVPPGLEAQSLNHWTAREVPCTSLEKQQKIDIF